MVQEHQWNVRREEFLVETWMDLPMGWEFQFVCRGSCLVEDLEGSDSFVVELFLGSWEAEVCRIEPYVVSDLVVSGRTLSFVILGFHLSGGFIKSLLSFLVNDGHGLSEVGSGGVHEWRGSRRVGDDSRVSAIQYHEGTLLCGAVDAVVVRELSQWEPVAPVHLSMIDKDLEIFLNLLIDSFRLSVHLWVECRRRVQSDVKHPVQLLHEL